MQDPIDRYRYPPTTVIHGDPQILFQRGFELLFGKLFPGSQVIGTNSAEETYSALESNDTANMLIVDQTMPGMNGLYGFRRFVEYQPTLPVIILSGHGHAEEILEYIKAGARAFIPKTADEMVLQNAIRLVQAGETFVPANVVEQLRSGLKNDRMDILNALEPNNPLHLLTNRQRDTLALLIEGLSNKEVARQLGMLESTVKAHVKMILRKLDAQNRTQAALIANDLGWPRTIKAHTRKQTDHSIK